MNKRDRAILYGMAAGDGCLYIQEPSARLVIGHGPKQLEYLEWKANKLHSIFGGKPVKVYTYQSLNKQVGKVYTNHQIAKTHNYFRQMHRMMRATGERKYTREWLDFLDDAGLAIWYMDDGAGTICKNKQGKISGCMTRISTYCSEEEALILRKWFEDKYNISPKFDVDKRNNKYSLRFNTQESRRFVEIVSPHVIPCMRYKVEHVDLHCTRVQDTPLG